jgi:hypothetical protein
MLGFDPLYLLLTLPGAAFAMWAQWRVQSTFTRYANIGTRRGLSGAETAAAILQVQGIRDVAIEPVQGFLADHYDPSSRTLRLSPDVFHGRSIAATGVAAHEVGHAIQHAEGYAMLQARSSLVPVLSVTSRLAMPLLFIGFGLASFGAAALGQLAMMAGIALFSVMVLFQLVTLPVEFDASRRALRAVERGHLLQGDELVGARTVLSAAALTYVAAAASAVLQLLYFLIRSGLLGGRRNDD